MKIQKILILFCIFSLIVLTNCLIEEVEQDSAVAAGGTFTATITVSDISAETATPHQGVLCVMVPEDWDFESGTYIAESDAGNQAGNMIVNPDEEPIYGNVNAVLPPLDDMKWVELLSEVGYLTPEGAIHEATVNFSVGQLGGDFPIGYVVTKNAADLLLENTLNLDDVDDEYAWADSSMGHWVTITGGSAIEDEIAAIPTGPMMLQNYPNI